MLTYSEDLSNAVWQKNNVTATSGIADPVGGMAAWTLTGNGSSGFLRGLQTSPVGVTVRISVYLKAGTATTAVIGDVNLGAIGSFNLSSGSVISGATSQITPAGDGWYRCSVSYTTISSGAFTINPGSSFSAATTSSVLVWGAQLELGSTATAYQRVGTAFDVTEAGVPTVHYVQYDGTDDSFSTSSIDFSATDKMSVFAGVRKLSDATRGIVAELSAAATSGAWNLNAPNATTTANYAFRNVGSLSGGDAVTSSTFAAPTSNVLTALGDIAADVSQLRVNGSVAATSAVDLGTGNYGNYPLYIGRRNNASLPFNGRDYGILVVGKTASATEITNTELWLSDRTAEVDVAKTISPNIYTRSGDTILDRANSTIERRAV